MQAAVETPQRGRPRHQGTRVRAFVGAFCLTLTLFGVASRTYTSRTDLPADWIPKHLVSCVTNRGLRPKTRPLKSEGRGDDENPELGLPPLRDRVFLVTGATDGIGKFTTEMLAKEGCTVLVHGRKEEKVLELMKNMTELYPEATFDGFACDLSRTDDVEELGVLIRDRHEKIHGILHNAATMDGEFSGNKKMAWGDYNEHTLAVNTMAPFLLTALLMPSLERAGAARVIISSSKGMGEPEALDDLNCEQGWSGNKAYRLSKLCGAMMAEEMHQRYGDAPRLTFHAIHPGTVDTKLMRHGSCHARGPRKGRHHFKFFLGFYPAVNTATTSYESLVNDEWQAESGRNVPNALPEVWDAGKRQQLWEDLVTLTAAEWPIPRRDRKLPEGQEAAAFLESEEQVPQAA